MEDIIVPREDLKPFILQAEKLGYTKLIVVDYTGTVPSSSKVSITCVRSRPGKGNVVLGSDKDRTVLERGDASVLHSVELASRDDFIHHRNSGFNQIHCKLMHAKNVKYGINFRNILKKKGFARSVLLGRIMQNILLCKKYKVKTSLYSFATHPLEMRNPKDLNAFGKLLGM